MGRKFGWHSGTLTCTDAKIQGDLYVQDDIVFSDVSAGTLGVTGGIDMNSTVAAIGINMGGTFSTSAININGTIGSAINITVSDATTNPSRLCFWQYTLTGNMSAGGATGIETRSTFNGSATTANSVTGAEIKARHTTGNIYTVGQLRGIVGNADTKNGITTTAYGVEGSIDVSAGGTITTSACFHGNLNNSGTVTTSYGLFVEGVSGYNLTKGIFMRYITTGIDIAACTTGLLISGTATTGISITGATTFGVQVTGSATTAFDAQSGTFSTGLNLAGTLTNAIVIGACTNGITMNGALTTGLAISGTSSAAISITGNATDAIKILTGTFTNGLNLAGTLTTGITIGACTTGINFSGAVTDAIVIAGTQTNVISITGAGTNLLSFDAVEGCVSGTPGTLTATHKIAINIDGVGTRYIHVGTVA